MIFSVVVLTVASLSAVVVYRDEPAGGGYRSDILASPARFLGPYVFPVIYPTFPAFL